MKIPETIKVGGHKVRIERVMQIEEGRSVGQWEPKKNLIMIDKSIPQSQMEVTLLHEIMHALNIALPEQDVEFLSQGLYQVLVDNQLSFDGKESPII